MSITTENTEKINTKKRDSSNLESSDNTAYESTQMQKDMIITLLKERGCRITKQRLIIIDTILEGNCSCSKEIYYLASKKDDKIGAATVYRMINTLEEIGAINRKNMYKVSCCEDCSRNACQILFRDGTSINLSAREWNQVIRKGLDACGLAEDKQVLSVNTKDCSLGSC